MSFRFAAAKTGIMGRSRKVASGEGKVVPSEKGQAGGSPVQKEREQGVVRVEGDIAYKLGVLSSLLRKSISEIVSPLLRPIIEKLYADAIKSAASAVEGEHD